MTECNFVTGSDYTRASQYVSWNDSECSSCRSRSPQELATVLILCHLSLPDSSRASYGRRGGGSNAMSRPPLVYNTFDLVLNKELTSMLGLLRTLAILGATCLVAPCQ